MNKVIAAALLCLPLAAWGKCQITERPIELEAGWENYIGPAMATKDCMGVVRLSGSIRNPGLPPHAADDPYPHSIAFKLPLQYCPDYLEIFPTHYAKVGGEVLIGTPPEADAVFCFGIVAFGSYLITPLTPISYRTSR